MIEFQRYGITTEWIAFDAALTAAAIRARFKGWVTVTVSEKEWKVTIDNCEIVGRLVTVVC